VATVAAVAAGVAVVALVWAAATAALVFSALEDATREAVVSALAPQAPLVGLAALLLAGLAAVVAQALYLRWVTAPARLLEQAQALVATDAERELTTEGGPDMRGIAQAFNALVRQRSELRRDMARQVDAASHGVEQERSRLAALMSELTQSVVVCNLDGRILLYNARARVQFRALSDAPALADGAELIGLGRSIYTVFDRRLVAHALASVGQRLARGVDNPLARFVTVTRAGQLLRVQMAPVREVPPHGDGGGREVPAHAGARSPQGDAASARGAPQLAGFVLMLENVTREFEQETERERLLHELTEGSRGSLATLQAAVEILDEPDLDAPTRERFLGVIRAEIRTMSARIKDVAGRSGRGIAGRWPLEEMLGADLLAAARSRIDAQVDVRVRVDEPQGEVWLKVDSFALLQALTYLADRLHDEHDVRDVLLRLETVDDGHASLDIGWFGGAMSTETVVAWETDPIRVGGEASPLTVREVVERHGGEFWFQRERARQLAFFRFMLPVATEREELEPETFIRSESRPEFYDFDLFRVTESTRALDERRLAELAFTVFDTETTGLAPSAGDEIIQIGAVRVVNGKLRRAESFEQLVDPRRSIPRESIPIHGIEPEMVVGQPTIDKVLPAFHAYAHDTVLVAHNAAFDMRFLQVKEAATGVRFEQPVLDTLLLSAVVHPNQESHKLESIAERFDIPVIGRHTALGDAIVTAEVLVRLIPLLAEKGVHTLAQAREAAQKTLYARIKY